MPKEGKNKSFIVKLKLQIQPSVVKSKNHLPQCVHIKDLSNLYNIFLFDFDTLFLSKLLILVCNSLFCH